MPSETLVQTAFWRIRRSAALHPASALRFVHRHFARQHVLRDLLRFGERVHLISAALVFVQLGDFALVFDIAHILHRGEPCIGDLLFGRRADKAHVETGAAAHRKYR